MIAKRQARRKSATRLKLKSLGVGKPSADTDLILEASIGCRADTISDRISRPAAAT
jgi:hypothetical protein